MKEAHDEVGLPLKATWTSEQTEEGVVKRLRLEDTGYFGLLGFLWNLVKSTIQPQDDLNMFGKVRGKSMGLKLSEMESYTLLAPPTDAQ